MGSSGGSGGDRRERGVTSTMLMNTGGYEWAEDMFTHVTAGREGLTPPRVPVDEFSSSTSSAMDTPWRTGVTGERRGDDGEGSFSERPPMGGGGSGHLCVAGVGW